MACVWFCQNLCAAAGGEERSERAAGALIIGLTVRWSPEEGWMGLPVSLQRITSFSLSRRCAPAWPVLGESPSLRYGES